MRVIFHLADRIMVLGGGLLPRGGHARRDREERAGPDGLPGEGGMNALEAEDLHTFYGKSHILHGIDL